MNILEENKRCFKDCFYSFSRVDVRSFSLLLSHSVPFSSVSSTLASVPSFPLSFHLFLFPIPFFGSTVFLSLFSRFFVFTFLIEKMIAFTLHGSSGPGGLRRFSSSQKGPCPAGETLPSFSAVESAATNPSPPFPGGSPGVKRGDPSHLSNINIGSTAESGRSIFNESSYLLVHNKKN